MLSTSKEPAAKEKDSTAKELFQWLIAILAAVAIALFVDNFLIVNAQIPSGSMENTIMTGDRVVGNRLSYLTKDPERYDVSFLSILMMKASFLSSVSSDCLVKPWRSVTVTFTLMALLNRSKM